MKTLGAPGAGRRRPLAPAPAQRQVNPVDSACEPLHCTAPPPLRTSQEDKWRELFLELLENYPNLS